MKPLTIVCCSYRRFDLLQRMVASCEASSLLPDRYILLSNGGNIGSVTEPIQKLSGDRAMRSYLEMPPPAKLQPRLDIQELPRCSVAKAWNQAFRMADEAGHGDYTVVTGDDVVFGKETLAGLVAEADAHPEALFIYPRVMSSQMFCVFLAKKAVFARIGGFDEQFFPAYYEDNDFFRRMKLAGIDPLAVDCDGYLHDVSSTLKNFNSHEMEEHHTQFRENQRRYMNKWGGLPGSEIYDVPRS
jgi:GT2 family glycosyltransferase